MLTILGGAAVVVLAAAAVLLWRQSGSSENRYHRGEREFSYVKLGLLILPASVLIALVVKFSGEDPTNQNLPPPYHRGDLPAATATPQVRVPEMNPAAGLEEAKLHGRMRRYPSLLQQKEAEHKARIRARTARRLRKQIRGLVRAVNRMREEMGRKSFKLRRGALRTPDLHRLRNKRKYWKDHLGLTRANLEVYKEAQRRQAERLAAQQVQPPPVYKPPDYTAPAPTPTPVVPRTAPAPTPAPKPPPSDDGKIGPDPAPTGGDKKASGPDPWVIPG